MAEDTTLLAHLLPRLTGRLEDAATDSLAFILNKSAACRGALDSLLKDVDFNPEPIARVETQVTYEDGSRPDMVGYGRGGAKCGQIPLTPDMSTFLAGGSAPRQNPFPPIFAGFLKHHLQIPMLICSWVVRLCEPRMIGVEMSSLGAQSFCTMRPHNYPKRSR